MSYITRDDFNDEYSTEGNIDEYDIEVAYHSHVSKNAQFEELSLIPADADENDTAREWYADNLRAAIEHEFFTNFKKEIWFHPADSATPYDAINDRKHLQESPFGSGVDPWGPAAAVITDAIKDIKSGMTIQNWNDNMAGNTVQSYAAKIYEQFLAKYNNIGTKKDPNWTSKVDPEDVKDTEDVWARPQDKAARDKQYKAAANTLAKRTKAQQAASRQVKTIDFKEQCFLLAKIFKLLEIRRDQIDKHEVKPLPYNNDSEPNACLMTDGEPYGFLNRLTAYPSQGTLFELTPAELSNLQPRIQLYKVGKGPKEEEVSQPIYFDGSATAGDLETFLKSSGKRGFGVGIKDFTFSYEGNNPFAVKKSIKASLTLFANSFDEMMKDRGGYRYIDLALKTGGEKLSQRVKEEELRFEQKSVLQSVVIPGDQQIENLAYLNYRVKAVVGWANPVNPGSVSSRLATAMNDSCVTLNLAPTIHEFSFDDTGRVTLKIQYWAYIEESYDEPLFSIFSDETSFKNKLERKIKFLSLDEDCSAAAMGEFKKQNMKQMEKDKRDSLQFIFNALSSASKIRYLSMPHSELKAFNSEGPYYEMKNSSKLTVATLKGTQASNLSSNIEEDIKDNSAQQQKDKPPAIEYVNTKVANANNAQLVFFYLSDLIDVVMAGIDKKLSNATKLLMEINAADTKNVIKDHILTAEFDALVSAYASWKKYRVLLGPVEIVSPENPEEIIFANLGDLPISLRYFMEWLTARTLKKDETTLPIAAFLNSLMNNLVGTFLNDDTCFNGDVKQSVRVYQSAVSGYKRKKEDPSDPITYYTEMYRKHYKTKHISRLPLDGETLAALRPILNISGDRTSPVVNPGVDTELNYMIYYAGRTQPVEHQNGDYNQDQLFGVQHYILGRDRGHIKNIQLKRTDVPYLAETRWQQQGFKGLAQLREVYDVSIDCWANVNAFPGLYIFVDPRGFAPNMGINLRKEGFQVDDLTDYGIGGYYMIIRSEHSFGPGRADTNITAKWVAELGPGEKGSALSKPGKPDPKKCSITVSAPKKGAPPVPPDAPVDAGIARKAARDKYLASLEAQLTEDQQGGRPDTQQPNESWESTWV